MLNFIVLDFDDYTAELLDEREFIEKYDVDPLDPRDYRSASDRITELVEGNCYDLAWPGAARMLLTKLLMKSSS